MGLQGVIRGKPHRTTLADKSAPRPLDKASRSSGCQHRTGSPTSRWRGSSSTLRPCWTGSPGVFWHGGYWSRWKPVLHRGCGGSSRPPAQTGYDRRCCDDRLNPPSSPRQTSSRCWPRAKSRSAWTAREPGVTTYSSSACGEPSNTRRSTCGPTPASQRPAPGSVGIWPSTMVAARIHRLTGNPRSGLLQPADARSRSGLTEAENHLEKARNLFR